MSDDKQQGGIVTLPISDAKLLCTFGLDYRAINPKPSSPQAASDAFFAEFDSQFRDVAKNVKRAEKWGRKPELRHTNESIQEEKEIDSENKRSKDALEKARASHENGILNGPKR